MENLICKIFGHLNRRKWVDIEGKSCLKRLNCMICGTKIREKGFHKMKAIEWDKTSTTVECQICNRKECHYEEIKKEVECATCNGSGGEIASDISGLTIECGCGGTGIDYDIVQYSSTSVLERGNDYT